MDNATRTRTGTLVQAIADGQQNALDDLLAHVYADLKALADRMFRGRGAGHTLEPTALVHEVYLRLADQDAMAWNGESHFLAVAAKAMRQILVDHHRRRNAAKRGGNWQRVTLSGADLGPTRDPIDFLALEDALETLAALDERQARVVELRFFGGLSMDQIAHVLGVSKTTAEGEWRHARAWLQLQLTRGTGTA